VRWLGAKKEKKEENWTGEDPGKTRNDEKQSKQRLVRRSSLEARRGTACRGITALWRWLQARGVKVGSGNEIDGSRIPKSQLFSS
jgi:hypothetical protein